MSGESVDQGQMSNISTGETINLDKGKAEEIGLTNNKIREESLKEKSKEEQSVAVKTEVGQRPKEEKVGQRRKEEKKEGQSLIEEKEGQRGTKEKEEGQSRAEEKEEGQRGTKEKEEGQSHAEEKKEGQRGIKEKEEGQRGTKEKEEGQRGTKEEEEGQRGTKEKEEGQRGTKEKEEGQRGTKEKEKGQRGTKEEEEGQRGTKEKEEGQRGIKEKEEGQRGIKEKEEGQRGIKEKEEGQNCAEKRRKGQRGIKEKEGQRGTKEEEERQRGTKEKEEGQSRAEEKKEGQRGIKEKKEGQRGTKEKEEGQRGIKEKEEGQRGTKEKEKGQRGIKEQEEGQRGTKEKEEGQRGTKEKEEGQRGTKEEEEGQSRAENYFQFLEYILKNYRFGLMMQTSLTFLVVVGWPLLWHPVKDGIYYQVLNYPKPPELDPYQVIHFMEQHQRNSECNLTELEERYTSLLRNYSALEKDMSALQLNYTELNGKLVEHEEKIANTSTLLEPIGQNVTEIKGKLQLQSERTNRVQKDIDTNMLRQIAEDFFLQYMWIILAFGEICLVLYMFRLKSKLGDRGRQPTTVVQSTEPVERVDTNEEDGYNNRPRSVLNGTFRTSTDNSVCVLSFNRDPAHKKHVQLSKSFLDEGVKVTDVVIQGEGDIPNIPLSKVVLVHVDFNARNIILENPEREIGELRRTTVQALWRMKADVILLYYYEERSAKPLGDQDLYSSDLESVRNQAELKRLEEQNRFISLNGQLSERQRQHLREVVKKKIETTPA